MARLGVVIRDSNGKVVVATVQWSRLQNSSANMKAEAMSLGIKTAHNAGYPPMVIGFDSQEVKDLILNMKGSITKISSIIVDIQDSLPRLN